MKKLCLINVLIFFSIFLYSQEEQKEIVEHSQENSECFECHSNPTYSYYNDVIERNVTKRMNPYFLIDSVKYYDQNHNSFVCTDCHAYEYKTFPHNRMLSMDPLPTCLDCHEGDDETADFNFEMIAEQCEQSAHSTNFSDEITCWSCHNPHTYKINARNNINVKETIVYDNNICLSCHSDINKYQLITAEAKPNIIEKHDWLPNQVAHFASIRCIECHAEFSDQVLVSHQIKSKENAVKKCVECHSKNSMLLASLYKYNVNESRRKFGFFNSDNLIDSYIIGANRNYYLNVLSAIIFGFVVLIVLVHAILRTIKK